MTDNKRFIEAAQNAETSIRLAELLHLADQRIASLEAELAIYKGREEAKQLVINQLESERDRAYTSFQFKLNNKREECEGLRGHVAYLKAKLVECHAELEAIKADRATSTSASEVNPEGQPK